MFFISVSSTSLSSRQNCPHHENVGGCGNTALCTLDLGIRWRLVVGFPFRPLYPWDKSLWYPLYRRLGGPQSQSEHGKEGKALSVPLLGINPQLFSP